MGFFICHRPVIPPQGPADLRDPTGRTVRGCAAPPRTEEGRAGVVSSPVAVTP